jgi:hypothetical protein
MTSASRNSMYETLEAYLELSSKITYQPKSKLGT